MLKLLVQVSLGPLGLKEQFSTFSLHLLLWSKINEKLSVSKYFALKQLRIIC